jgi:GNAT superfamily N-acetyltransferase
VKARALTPEDLSALSALRLEGIRLYPNAFLLTEAEAVQAPQTQILNWLMSGNVHGVTDGRRLVGFAGMHGQGFALSRHRMHVGPFYVTPERHGTGAAELLLDHLVDTARAARASQLELWVAEGNMQARAFYAKHGFAAHGRIPSAVILDGVRSDDLFMVRNLRTPRPKPGRDGTRRLGPGDWRLFRDIRFEMLENAPRGFGATLAEWQAKAPDQIVAWLDAISLWAVVRGGRVVATVGWHPLPGAVQAHRGHVIAAYTRPEVRGQGLVAGLLKKVEDDARAEGIVQLELDVGADNAAACAAYTRAGYDIVGTIPGALNHDGHITDQHYMVKRLVD